MDWSSTSERTIMRIASIDIGTNTILLLIVEADKNGIVKVLHDEQVIARLGKGVDADRVINQETFSRAEAFLKEYKDTCNRFNVNTIIAVGTSALRDAINQIEFCEYIYSKTGIRIEIISGDEEAQWTYMGGISKFKDASNRFTVVDIGGGSTEIITGNSVTIESKISLNIGSVRITERILKTSPPENNSVEEAHEFILSQIPSTISNQISSSFPIGVAGTVTTLAAMNQQLSHYDSEKIDGFSLQYDDIIEVFDKLKVLALNQIKSIPQISPGRADIILAGILILLGFMEKTRLKIIRVSDRGLRYGIIFREIKKLFY